MSSALAAAPPSDSRFAIQNASPLHLQLLLMMGSCHNNPTVMTEAEQVQKLLLSLEPEVDPSSNTGASAVPKKKGPKAAVKSSGSSAPAKPNMPIAAPSDDPNVPWSKPSLKALESSTDPQALLKLALLHDPANPWQLHLHDVDKAIKYYGLAAIKIPSTYACARLAHFYITGDVVPGGKDAVKGAKWLRMGASKGHALCQYQLGFLLEEGGMGVPKDVKQAVEWYKKAAELKYPAAMYNLATILLESDGTHPGVEQDIYTGIRLMEDAAALGDASSQLKLGHLCFLGNEELEIEASIDRCVQYLTMATFNENEPSIDAAKILGIIYSTAETNSYENPYYDIEKSIRFLKIAADSGHADSKVLLQRQMAKRTKIQSGMVIDTHSKHLEAVKKLQAQQEGAVMATVVDEGKEAAKGLTSTPSPESLFLALARLHSRFPDYGSARLHQCVKGEYPHWEVSEKRVKKVMKENNWTAEAVTPAIVLEANPAPAAAQSASSVSSTTAALNNMRINEKAIVNDLD